MKHHVQLNEVSIRNRCARCGQPVTLTTHIPSYYWFARFARNVACHNCDPRSQWRREEEP